jgi:hypothetical protein
MLEREIEELAAPERRLSVAEAVTAGVEEFCASRGKLSLVERRRANRPVLQSPRLPKASGRRHYPVMSAFVPRKRSRASQAQALDRAEIRQRRSTEPRLGTEIG